jgi:putative peptide zinc metalloprotease protein
MAEAQSTFSESWHRVAGQRIALQPAARLRRQNFRGERWFVVENPFTNEFFRLTPAAYEFVARLHPQRTVDEVWRECLERFPDQAPGQGQVLELLGQLYFANLLQYDRATNASELFERYRKRQRREWQARFLNLMFMRFPLLDPDRFLVRTLPVVGKFISAFGAVLWLGVVGMAAKLVADNWDAVKQQSQGVLAPSNLPLLYLGMAIIKTIHEFGHAYFTRKFGGEVHVMGIMLMIFTPVPYVDATASWGFRSRWQRILVGSAGMIVELFFAALMTFVWANTGQGALHSLAYNMMFIASVSTVIFNANPLLRFDGYYILSDLLEIPNLSQRANQLLRYGAERWLFGLKRSQNPARSRAELGWLSVFGVSSGIYRVFVFGGILLVVADHFFLIGVVMAAICFVSWVTVPLFKFINYLATSPKLERHRFRAVLVSLTLVLLLVGVLEFVPFPSHFRAPGVLQARRWTQVVNESAGSITQLLAEPGQRVRAGQPLVRFQSQELELELAQAQANQVELQTRLRAVLPDEAANLKPLLGMLEAATNRVAKLLFDRDALTVRARHDGLWLAPELKESLGRWLQRGTPLGLLVDPSSFQFTATVQQEEAEALFARNLRRAEVRLYGQIDDVLETRQWRVLPGGQRVLPSPALGWQGGGEMPVARDDPQGRKSAELFFEVHAELSGANERAAQHVQWLHGRSGKIRFDQEWEPLLPRWIRSLRQLLQRRYQL